MKISRLSADKRILEKVGSFVDLLGWARTNEGDRPHTGVARRRRIAVVVVESVSRCINDVALTSLYWQ